MTTEKYFAIRQAIAEIIQGTQWQNHVDLVGGCVRDEIMHYDIHDIDLAIDKPNGGVLFAKWLARKRLLARGRSLQIFIHYGTAKVKLRRYPEEEIDCVQTRKGRYEYDRHPKPEKYFGTILEDAACRDLTINSLYLNVSTGEILDPTGRGLKDLEDHIIRTPNDPDISLLDNPMHILRCIRFAVRYGWALDDTLIHSMKRNVDILADALPRPRRIIKEMTAIQALPDKDRAMQLIETAGAIKYIEPVLQLMKTISIDNKTNTKTEALGSKPSKQGTPSSELCTGDGRSHPHVKRFRRHSACRKSRNKQSAADQGSNVN